MFLAKKKHFAYLNTIHSKTCPATEKGPSPGMVAEVADNADNVFSPTLLTDSQLFHLTHFPYRRKERPYLVEWVNPPL